MASSDTSCLSASTFLSSCRSTSFALSTFLLIFTLLHQHARAAGAVRPPREGTRGREGGIGEGAGESRRAVSSAGGSSTCTSSYLITFPFLIVISSSFPFTPLPSRPSSRPSYCFSSFPYPSRPFPPLFPSQLPFFPILLSSSGPWYLPLSLSHSLQQLSEPKQDGVAKPASGEDSNGASLRDQVWVMSEEIPIGSLTRHHTLFANYIPLNNLFPFCRYDCHVAGEGANCASRSRDTHEAIAGGFWFPSHSLFHSLFSPTTRAFDFPFW